MVGVSWLQYYLIELFNIIAFPHFEALSSFADSISESCSQLTDVFGLREALDQPHRTINSQVSHPAARPVHVERVAHFPVYSHAEIIAKMFGNALSFDDFILTVFYFLKFAVWLDLCLHHPNIQVFLLRAQPVGHPLLQLLKVVGEEVWAFLSPAQSL